MSRRTPTTVYETIHHPVPPIPPPPANINVDAYDYSMGIYDIQVLGQEYAHVGCYVSKPLKISGSPVQAELIEVGETHPDYTFLKEGQTDRMTAIEYYISYKTLPTASDWISILPKWQEQIKTELIMFKRDPINGFPLQEATGKLRFTADRKKDIKVFQNSIELSPQYWEMSSDYNYVTIRDDENFTIGAETYTIDYYPDKEVQDPYIINFKKDGMEANEIVETFNGTNRNGIVFLENYPYIDFSRINVEDNSYYPIKVELINANIAGPEQTTLDYVPDEATKDSRITYTKNMTDYSFDSNPELEKYSIELDNSGLPIQPVFQYLHNGNTLVFTETFKKSDIIENQEFNHGNATIKVTYQRLASVVRFKIIMRNLSDINATTPFLESYKLKFNVIK